LNIAVAIELQLRCQNMKGWISSDCNARTHTGNGVVFSCRRAPVQAAVCRAATKTDVSNISKATIILFSSDER
jgi:hypothetical protein